MHPTSPSNTKQLKVLLLGSNPSIKSQSDFAFFLDSKSSKTLQKWIEGVDAIFMYGNVSNAKTENNRPLTKAEIKASLPDLVKRLQMDTPDRIVALGKTAAEALTLLQLSFLEMPHPSGRNRVLNNKEKLKITLQNFKIFCENNTRVTE